MGRWNDLGITPVALLGAALFCLPVSYSATTVTVSVTVLAPPACVINGERPIEVDFGDEVMTTRVDGSNFKRPIDYTLSCSGLSKNALKMQVQGTGAAFDGTVLKTDKSGLGIAILNGGSRWALNSWTNFTYPNKPTLTAVPVKQSGATLQGGAFNASATLRVDYQ
ncbi:fimbrial protein [Serratia nevei]|uniref:fimbrial protein n=1 Tax=Serratia nevei TaxID=2703794 RepID=UPI00344B7272